MKTGQDGRVARPSFIFLAMQIDQQQATFARQSFPSQRVRIDAEPHKPDGCGKNVFTLPQGAIEAFKAPLTGQSLHDMNWSSLL